MLRYMSPDPIALPPTATLEEAHRQMHRAGVRHLLVVEGDAVVGVVSDRDLLLLRSLGDVDPAVETVEEAMSESPFTCRPGDDPSQVLRIMAERRYGCAVVLGEGGGVIGIFTTTDALRWLADTLAEAERRARAVA